jgi:hypothetical protein
VNLLRYSNGKNLGEMLTVKRRIPIDVTSIDQWRENENIPPLDFIKLNVQAAELEILHGAESSLSDVLGIQLEMAFQQTYMGAPFFSDIDPVLRRHGFFLFDMLSINLVGREVSKVSFPTIAWHQSFRWPSRQMLEGIFLYLRDPISDSIPWPVEKVVKLALLAELYGQEEYALELFDWLAKRTDLNSTERDTIDKVNRQAIDVLLA